MAIYYNLSGSLDQYKRKDWYNQFEGHDLWQFDKCVIIDDHEMAFPDLRDNIGEELLHRDIKLARPFLGFNIHQQPISKWREQDAVMVVLGMGIVGNSYVSAVNQIVELSNSGYKGKIFVLTRSEAIVAHEQLLRQFNGFWWLWGTNESIEVNNQEKEFDRIEGSIDGKEIQEIRNEPQYYFRKAQVLIQEFLDFDELSTDQIIAHQTTFTNRKTTFSEYYQGLKPESVDAKFFEMIGALVSYIDVKGYKKYDWNEYAPPRSLAYTGVNQTNIVKNLLIFRILGLSEVKSVNVRRALGQLIDPIGKVHVISDKHRRLILKNLLKEEKPELKLFHAKLYRYFQKEIRTLRNPINASVLVARILYTQQVKSLWQLEEPLYNEEDEDSEEEKSTEHIYPGYDADKDKGEDLLDIRDDYVALATLIGFKQLKPPLAIGLFGNWGSGKSFFMEKLYSEIEWLKEKERIRDEDDYCTHIVQVRFNAWHYSDTNLWASLIRTIFHQLKLEGEKQEKKEDIEQILYERISSSKKIIQKAEKELEKVEEVRGQEIENLKIKSQERLQVEGFLKGITSEFFIKKIENDPAVQNDIAKVKEAWGAKKGSDVSLSNILREGMSTGKRLKKSISNKAGIILFSVLAILVFAFTQFPENWSISNVTDWFIEGFWKPMATILIPPLVYAGSQFQKLSKPISSIKKISDEYINKNRSEWESKREILDAEVIAAKQKLTEAELKLKNDTQTLEDIKTGKHLYDLVEHKADLYEAELGLISMIRKDLDSLLNELDRVEKKNENFWVDRIVLYIDDLDRCPEKKVVEVLQAIHLLLAIDRLFVAVVGVDPRWVSRAIESQYQELLHEGKENNGITPATSFDYLEKIFQIPIALQPVSDKGAKNMVKNLLLSPKETSKREEEGNDSGTDDTLGTTEPQTQRPDSIGGPVIEDDRLEIKRLEISDKEKEFMEFFAPIIGTTPRTVKRYINLYRLVKAHKDIPDEMVGDSQELHGIICLLAIVVAYPKCAQFVLKKAQKSNAENLYYFIKALDNDIDGIKNLQDDFLGLANTEIQKHHWELIRDMSLSDLTKHIQHISKFSFRAIALNA